MITLALSLAAAATPAPRLTVNFVAPAEIHFNRRGDSTLTVMVGKTSRTVTLDGILDPADPDNVYLSLKPIALAFDRKFGGTVHLKARLFLCDALIGVCTVQELEKQVRLRPGQPLALIWKVGAESR